MAEETEPDQKVEEKALLEQVLDALKEPSGEHMKIYACLGMALVVIAGIVYMSMTPAKQIKVTLDDVELSEEEKPKKKRAGIKRPDGAPAAKAAAVKKEDDDWEDDPYDKDTLYKMIDESGPFPKSMTGTLEPEGFVKLRRCIHRHTYMCFKDVKEELLEERIKYFKADKMKEYQGCLQKAQQKYGQYLVNVTQLAAEFIDLDAANFEASFKEAQAIPEIAQKLHKDEEEVRVICETKRDPPLTKAQVKEALITKMKLEIESEKKLKNLRVPSQEHAKQIMMFERTKVMD